MKKKNLVALTGAGISAESGIATFRDADGLWENHRIEEVASPEGWKKNPDLVTRFYNLRRKSVLTAQQNAAHIGLVQLEDKYNVHIITQNIDDLHERAGSKNVLHLHGEILKMRCEENKNEVQTIRTDIDEHTRSSSGMRMRPDIVWFGESVDNMPEAISITEQADLFVIIGTSMNVYPAAGLIYATPVHCNIFVIDKNIPHIQSSGKLTTIEQPATIGIQELLRILQND